MNGNHKPTKFYGSVNVRARGRHESPGEATLQVLVGRVRLTNAEAHWEGTVGDHIVVPRSRHSLQALADSAVLLTVTKRLAPMPSGSR
ncbi:MAG: hypothetical protein NVS4B6_13770 [Mycobacterium sp.]